MKQFLKDKAVILILIVLTISIFALGNVYFNSVVYVEETTTTTQTTTMEINLPYDSISNITIEHNFDLDSIGTKSYIVSFDYESQTYQVYVDNDYFFIEMVSGTAPEQEVLCLLREHIIDDELVQDKAYFVSYDSTTRTLVMEAIGFVYDKPIQVTIVLNENLDAVSSFNVVSYENYDNEYNNKYSGGAVPEVENDMIDDYLVNGLPIDSVAGASRGTGVAMIELITLLDLLLDSVQGGN